MFPEPIGGPPNNALKLTKPIQERAPRPPASHHPPPCRVARSSFIRSSQRNAAFDGCSYNGATNGANDGAPMHTPSSARNVEAGARRGSLAAHLWAFVGRRLSRRLHRKGQAPRQPPSLSGRPVLGCQGSFSFETR